MNNGKPKEARDIARMAREYFRFLQSLPLDGIVVPARKAAAAPRPSPVTVPRPSPPPSRRESLEDIRAHIGDCRKCRLSEKRTTIVFGAGNPAARLIFVGEGPGQDEDEQGVPFVGRAGQKLTDIINSMGMKRDDVYICNVVKCRPPNNRTPHPDEVSQCLPFLERQIASIQPRIIVTLGNVPTGALLGITPSITRIRGHIQHYGGIPLMPTFHPSYLLRDPSRKKYTWQDMQYVMKFLGLPLPPRRGGT